MFTASNTTQVNLSKLTAWVRRNRKGSVNYATKEPILNLGEFHGLQHAASSFGTWLILLLTGWQRISRAS